VTAVLPDDPATPGAAAVPAGSSSPVSPVSGAAPETDLDRVLEVYRRLQIHHARLVNVEASRRGLGLTDLRFLFSLAARPGGSVLPKEATAYLGLSTGAMTSLIDRLEQRDLVRRIPNPNDRRSVEVVILDAGTRTVDEVKDVYREAFTTAVPADQMGTLATLLEAFDAELAAHGARA
jgi:DNA-binding MarR family transcriptional regulator